MLPIPDIVLGEAVLPVVQWVRRVLLLLLEKAGLGFT